MDTVIRKLITLAHKYKRYGIHEKLQLEHHTALPTDTLLADEIFKGAIDKGSISIYLNDNYNQSAIYFGAVAFRLYSDHIEYPFAYKKVDMQEILDYAELYFDRNLVNKNNK